MYFRIKSTSMATTFSLIAICLVIAGAAPLEAKSELTDETISDKIDDELRFDRGVTSSKIDVHTSRGIVTLTGEVNNLLAKERAVRIAQTVKGVRTVVDRIEVNPSEARSDVEIQKDIEAAFVNNPATDSYEISASVHSGQVTLTGVVDSYQERELVKTVAKSVRGVTAIDDQIEVDFKTERSDNEIAQEIKEALSWDARVDDDLIDVRVNDGKVVLSGIVGSAAEKRLAETSAWVAGVTMVDVAELSVENWTRDDKLRTNKYAAKTKGDLQEAVKDALRSDPRVFSFKVDVDVTGSIVTLRGTVNSLRTKRAAGEDARNTVGVSYVSNRLKVRPQNLLRDPEVADNVREAFLRDPYVERFDIRVTVRDGTAHLYGIVDSNFEKIRADHVASRITGVLEVENHLKVDDNGSYASDPYVDEFDFDPSYSRENERQSTRKTDAEIKNAIVDALWWSPYVNEDKVKVSVDGGVATLTGRVGTWTESQAATTNAYQSGAVWVNNELMINYR